MKLEGILQSVEMTAGVRSDTYDSIGNADVAFGRNFVDIFFWKIIQMDLNAGISLSTDGASINELSSKPWTDLTLQRAGVNYITLADGRIQFHQPTNLTYNIKFK